MPRRADEHLEGRILDSAYRLWSVGGEHALTMRAVADAANTTTPTVYERFRDKHELLASLRNRARQKMFDAIQPAKSGGEFCRLALEFTQTHGKEYLLLTSDWAERLGRKEKLPSYESLKEKLAADLGGKPADHARLAMSLIALVHGTAILLLAEGVDARVAKEVAGATIYACQSLINTAKNGYDGKAQDTSLGL